MINVVVKGIPIIKRRINKTRQDLKKRRQVNAKAVIILDRWIQKNFQQEGKLAEPGGWEKLAESTIKRRRQGKKAKLGTRILQDTGQLRSRWEHKYNDRIAKIRSKVNYGIYHDSDEPRKRLPRRQILPDFKHVDEQISKIFSGFVDKTIKHNENL